METVAVVLVGCSTKQVSKELKPSWNGFYLGAQNVTPLRNYSPSADSTSLYGNAIWNIGGKMSFQIEPIMPFTKPDAPLLRIAVDRKLF